MKTVRPFSTTTRVAHMRAQENANYFGVPYVCFFDTSGTYRCERYDASSTIHNDPHSHFITPEIKS